MNHYREFIANKKINKCLQLILILAMIISIGFIVYLTGGTASSIPNMMYLPIILTSFTFGMRGGIIVAIIAGIALGPLMPTDVQTGTMQNPHSWIIRICFYLLISITISLLLKNINKMNKEMQNKAFENPYVGLPNLNKFLYDMEELIEKDPKGFTMLAFKFENFKQISRHIDLFLGRKSIQYLLDEMKGYFKGKPLYVSHLDEYIVILPETDVITSFSIAEKFMSLYDKVHYVNNVPLFFQLKCGIVNYPLHGANNKTILQNLARVLEQAEDTDKKLTIFDGYLAQNQLENYHNLMSFIKGLKEEKLTLYYQPKIDLKSGEIVGFEALLRWKDPAMHYMAIDKVIRAVENAGMISQLTKWVVEKSIIQISEWQAKGFNVNVSVNLSSKDLSNGALLEYTKTYIEKYKIDPELYEYELTERSLIENHGKSVTYLNELKKLGLKISIDDYGVGYNSLLNMISLPVDYIKIDKYFIKNINDVQGKKLVDDMISLIHNLGKKVLAEGVETADQERSLLKLGCDFVQGYYYSKPMPADQVVDFLNDYVSQGKYTEPLYLA